MRRLFRISAFVVLVILTLLPTVVQAFNPATHIYIAARVLENCTPKTDLYYGSIAPDIALYVENYDDWPAAFNDTHYGYIDLRPYAWGPTQRAFARGWLTHNEAWGADYYAHIWYQGNDNMGYVIEKAQSLLLNSNLNPDLNLEFAHYAIETAVDLLLKNDDPGLPYQLLFSNLLRSWQDRNLLARVLVWKDGKTDWLTLAAAELTFRNLVGRYAVALSLPGPADKASLAELGAQLAQELYGIDVTVADVLEILEAAIALCAEDYKGVVDHAIEEIRHSISE